jgi:hypothetical protein
VERLLGEHQRGPDPLAARAIVSREPNGYRVVLATEWRGVHGERTIDAHSCEELGSAVAIILALTIEPTATAAPAKSLEGTPALPPAGPPPPARRRFAVGMGGAGQTGALPTLGAGPEIVASYLPTTYRFELALAYFPAQTRLVDGARGADIQLFDGTLRACKALSDDARELGACLSIDGGALVGKGIGIRLPSVGAAPWLAAGAGVIAGLRLPRGGPFAVLLTVEGGASLARYRFEVDAVGLVYQAAPFSARASLRGEYRF